MNGVHAEEVDAQFFCVEFHDFEAFLENLFRKLRAPQRPGPCIKEHVFADIAFGAADRDFQCRRSWFARNATDAHAIGTDLLKLRSGEIDNGVRCDVVRRIVNFIEHLFFYRHQVYGTTGSRDFGQHRCSIILDFNDGKRQVPRSGHVLEPGIGEISTGNLCAAFDQMTEAAASRQVQVIECVPAKFVHHRRHKD